MVVEPLGFGSCTQMEDQEDCLVASMRIPGEITVPQSTQNR